ncbi:MAG: Ig-like domain-containing protein [Patescibacteria group bacterium]
MSHIGNQQIKFSSFAQKVAFYLTTIFAVALLSARGVSANDAPVANPDAYSKSEDKILETSVVTGVLANDTDVENNTLYATLVDNVSHGALIFNTDGSFTYTPDENYNGDDLFTYTTNDGEFDSGEAVVNITLIATNDEPSGTDNTITVEENGFYTFSAGDFGFQDVDGDTMSAVRIDTLPEKGALTLNNEAFLPETIIDVSVLAKGDLVFAPAADEDGDNYDSFTFRVIDGSGEENSTGLSVNSIFVNVSPANEAPLAFDDETYITDEDSALSISAGEGVLQNDTDADEDALSTVIVSDPENGTVLLDEDGGFTYTPNTGYQGVDLFTYKAFDGLSYSNVATVYINVNNAPPYVVSAIAIGLDTIEIKFNEYLQNNDTHSPQIEDFKIYRSNASDASEISVNRVSYLNKIVTLNLDSSINYDDVPVYQVLPVLTTIIDEAGNQIDELITGDVEDRVAPIAVISPISESITVRENVNFSAIGSSDVYSGIQNYVWNFGDGNISTTTASNTSHTYGTAGTYYTTVRVYDNNGNSAVAGLSITVNAISSSGGGGSSGGSSTSSQPTDFLSGNSASTTTIYSASTTTPKVAGQVLGEKISRIDELIALTRYAERSANVRELQLELKNAGFFPKYQIATGYFGPITLTSVKKYLASQNRLAELRNSKIDEFIALTKYGEHSDNVKSLQTELKNAGFFPKYQIATGYFGPITLASVKKYQACITL